MSKKSRAPRQGRSLPADIGNQIHEALLATLSNLMAPREQALSEDAEADFSSYIEHALPARLKELDFLDAADVRQPRILLCSRRPGADPDRWRVRNVHTGHPLLFPDGVASLFTFMDETIASDEAALALWHMSVPNPLGDSAAHLFYMRHRTGADAQVVVRDGEFLELPLSSDIGRKMVLECFDDEKAAKSRRLLMAPFRPIAETLAGKTDGLNSLLIAKGFLPLQSGDPRIAVMAQWVLDEEHLLPAILPFLRTLTREVLEADITSVVTLALKTSERALEMLETERAAAEAEREETYQRKHRRVFEELETTKLLMAGAREGATRAQAEIRELKTQLAGLSAQADPVVKGDPLADALNELFV